MFWYLMQVKETFWRPSFGVCEGWLIMDTCPIDLYLDFVREFMFSTDATPGAFGGLSVQDVFTLLDLSFHLQLGKALCQLSLCLSVSSPCGPFLRGLVVCVSRV